MSTRGFFLSVATTASLLAGSACATPSISGEAAKNLVTQKGAFLLDVRTPEEFKEGHVAGATNIPVQVLESRMAELSDKKDVDIVVYCRSGMRSAKAAAMLKEKGFTKVHDLGGMSNWK